MEVCVVLMLYFAFLGRHHRTKPRFFCIFDDFVGIIIAIHWKSLTEWTSRRRDGRFAICFWTVRNKCPESTGRMRPRLNKLSYWASFLCVLFLLYSRLHSSMRMGFRSLVSFLDRSKFGCSARSLKRYHKMPAFRHRRKIIEKRFLISRTYSTKTCHGTHVHRIRHTVYDKKSIVFWNPISLSKLSG